MCEDKYWTFVCVCAPCAVLRHIHSAKIKLRNDSVPIRVRESSMHHHHHDVIHCGSMRLWLAIRKWFAFSFEIVPFCDFVCGVLMGRYFLRCVYTLTQPITTVCSTVWPGRAYTPLAAIRSINNIPAKGNWTKFNGITWNSSFSPIECCTHTFDADASAKRKCTQAHNCAPDK